MAGLKVPVPELAKNLILRCLQTEMESATTHVIRQTSVPQTTDLPYLASLWEKNQTKPNNNNKNLLIDFCIFGFLFVFSLSFSLSFPFQILTILFTYYTYIYMQYKYPIQDLEFESSSYLCL